MKPDREGIWEWFDEDGNRRLVEVFNVMKNIPGHRPYLRVYWWGGYYNVNDEVTNLYDCQGNIVEKNIVDEAEWTDSWGVRVGDNQSIPQDQLYLMPTPEELELFREKDKQ